MAIITDDKLQVTADFMVSTLLASEGSLPAALVVADRRLCQRSLCQSGTKFRSAEPTIQPQEN